MKRLRKLIPVLTLGLAVVACSGGQPANQAPPAAAPQAAAPQPAAPQPAATPPDTAAAAAPAPAATGTTGPVEAPPAAAAPAPKRTAAKPAVKEAASPVDTATHPASSLPVVPATPPPPPPPPEPRFRELTIPAGTTIALTLTTPLASDTNKVEDPVTAKVSHAVSVDGITLIPDGAEVNGTVLDVKASGRVKGLASIAFRFDKVHARSETHTIVTDRIFREAKSTAGKDAAKVGIGAGVGAAIGAIAGGGKGAAIGSAVGGGAATGATLATKGEEVRLPAGTPVTATLTEPLVVRVRVE